MLNESVKTVIFANMRQCVAFATKLQAVKLYATFMFLQDIRVSKRQRCFAVSSLLMRSVSDRIFLA